MSNNENGPVRLAEGVKCPYCLDGVFKFHSRASRDSYGQDVEWSYWRCNKVHPGRVSESYTSSAEEFFGGWWAVVDGRVKLIKHER